MEYGIDYLYNHTFYKVTYENIEKFKNIKYEIFDSTFVYIEKLIMWKDDENEDLIKDFSVYLNIFVRNVVFNDNFIKKYNVKKYHIGLIRRMHIEYNNYFESAINLGLKRPYGNSDVMQDIVNIYLSSIDNNELQKLYKKYNEVDIDKLMTTFKENNYDFLLNIHIEALNIVGKAVKELDLNSLIYQQQYFSLNYKETEEGVKLYKEKLRIEKLKRILYDL